MGATMAFTNVTDQNFDAEVVQASSTLPVLVDFWAPWCEPCKMIRAEIQRAAEAFKDQVEVVRVDVDAFHSLAEKYDIMAIPTLLFFKDGKPVKRIIGYASEEEIRKFLATLV